MLKQTVTYNNFDNKEVTKTLYFHISKSRVALDFDLQDELEKGQAEIRAIYEAPEHELEKNEIRKMLDLIKRYIQLSYGERSADGEHFDQSPETWQLFTQTAAYDAFLFSLFQDVSKLLAFVTGIIPEDMRAEVEQSVRKEQPELAKFLDEPNSVAASAGTHNAPDIPAEPLGDEKTSTDVIDTRPPWIRENREPTGKELQSMSHDELQEAYRRRLEL